MNSLTLLRAPLWNTVTRIGALPVLIAGFVVVSLALAQPKPAPSPVPAQTKIEAKPSKLKPAPVATPPTPPTAIAPEPTLASFGDGPEATTKVQAALNEFYAEAQNNGFFPKEKTGRTGEMFKKHWDKQLRHLTTPATLGTVGKSLTKKEMAMFIYTAALDEVAAELDAEDKKTAQLKAQGLPTKGEEFKKESLDEEQPATGIAVGLALGVALKWTLDKLFIGPSSQFGNTLTEPVIRPPLNRLNRIVNSTVNPYLVKIGWTGWWTGEKGVQERALKAQAEGKELEGSANRYSHPSVSVQDFVRDHEIFMNESMKAEAMHRGWMVDELAKARGSGFELIYNNTKYLNEQLNTFSNAEKQAKMAQAVVCIPKLLAGGASQEDIERLGQLIQKQQDILIFEDVHSPEADALWEPIVGILKKWTDLGISETTIYDFYRGETDIVMAKNRAAFSLASFLDAERYFQEYNVAIGKLKVFQKWQELGKDMSGIYGSLREHRARIEAYFAKRGIHYDVTARISERGYPLGGERRPAHVKAFDDRAMSYLESRSNLNDPIRVSVIAPEIEVENVNHAPVRGPEVAKLTLKQRATNLCRALMRQLARLTKPAAKASESY